MLDFLFREDLELRPKGRKISWFLGIIYFVLLCRLCFGPQFSLDGAETPGIQHFGRVVVLLMPFNSLVTIGQVDSFPQLIWVFGQNILNILLLYPLVFLLLFLYPRFRSWKKSLLLAFMMSLGIEVTQVIIDILFNANRVFEIDDLWTNSLGGLLAYLSYRKLSVYVKKKRSLS